MIYPDSRQIHIGRVFQTVHLEDKDLHLLLTENGDVKYFYHKSVYIKSVSLKYITFAQIDLDSTEVFYMGTLDEYVIKEVESGNDKANEVYVSEENIEFLNTQEKAILSFEGGKYYFYFGNPYITINGKSHRISQNPLTDAESLLLDYIKINPSGKRRVLTGLYLSDDEILAKAEEINALVDSLDINDIINSYSIKVDSFYHTKIGGDDSYKEFFKTTCKYWDDYLYKILPNYCDTLYTDKGYGIVYPSRKESEEWEEIAVSKTLEVKEKAQKEYNKEAHKTILLASYIKKKDSEYYSTKIDTVKLETEAKDMWEKDRPYFCVDKYQKHYLEDLFARIDKYNNRKKTLLL